MNTHYQPGAQAMGQSAAAFASRTLRYLFPVIATLAWTVLQSSAQEPKPGEPEPPIRLKRKDKPEEAKPAVKEPDKGDREKPKDEPALTPQEDAKQIMERIAKNMRAAEERLKSKDAGDGTQQVQRDIVKDLDKLIEQSKQQDQNQSQQQSMAGSGGKSSRGSRQQRAAGGQGSRPKPLQQGKEDAGQGQANSKGQSSGPVNQGGQGSSSTGPNHIADLHKDIWGHLPEAMRQQMDAYARETFMLKYQDLLRQYYATIAEKGRRGGEEAR